MIKLFNSETKKNEILRPIKPNKVSLYSCGPTVYNYAHIGNLRAYVFIDVLKRYLNYRGFSVNHVMNITDVDDKTIRGSQKTNKTIKEFTDFYLKAFIEDIRNLNIELPYVMPRATEHIAEMVRMIKKLLEKGYAYKVNGSVYYKISKFTSYGELAQIKKQDLRKNADGRLDYKDDYKKEEVNDFVLWKAWQPEDGDVFWDTEIGRGRPGWHIECSAMSMKYLGSNIDIHSGGIDLIFPHHTNEIAQSEAVTGKKFVNHWLHNAHLVVDGKKMSKSLNNFYTLEDIESKGYNPLLLRLVLLKTHYRQVLNFTLKSLDETRSISRKFLDVLINLNSIDNSIKGGLGIDAEINRSRNNFKKAMDDDLNISLALAGILGFIDFVNRNVKLFNRGQAEKIEKFIYEIDSIFGFIKPLYGQYKKVKNKTINNNSVKLLLEKRLEMRRNNNYEEADKIRKKLLERGICINDTQNGYNVTFLNFP